jgi:DNA-binding PadR family transcriptional regulator
MHNRWFDWGAFGPRGARATFFRPGEVRLALLSLLSEGPTHGYDLMKRLEARSGGLYSASAGTVYPVLQQLEDEGLALSTEEDGKRVYRLTDAGRAELEREGEAVERIWRRAGRWKEWGQWFDPESVDIATAIGRVAKAAFRAASGEHARVEGVLHVLDHAREELESLRTG